MTKALSASSLSYFNPMGAFGQHFTLKSCASSLSTTWILQGFPGVSSGKELAFQCRRCKRHGCDLWVGCLEEGTATHSSILAWRIPQTEESGGLQFIGWQRIGHDWSDLSSVFHPGLFAMDSILFLRPQGKKENLIPSFPYFSPLLTSWES